MLLLGVLAVAPTRAFAQPDTERPTVKQAPKKSTPKKPAAAKRKMPAQGMFFEDLEVGKVGYLTWGNPQLGLIPVQINSIDDGEFVASFTSANSGKRWRVIVRGVKTDGMVTERWVTLRGEVRVSGTDTVGRDTVFVLEPTESDRFVLQPSDKPDGAE
jgi:hypothetical protein